MLPILRMYIILRLRTPNAIQKIQIRSLRLRHSPINPLCRFSLETLPAHGFCVPGLRLPEFGFPFALDLVHFAFLFAFFWFPVAGDGRRGRSVDEEAGGDLVGWDIGELGFGEGDEVADELFGISTVVDGG